MNDTGSLQHYTSIISSIVIIFSTIQNPKTCSFTHIKQTNKQLPCLFTCLSQQFLAKISPSEWSCGNKFKPNKVEFQYNPI